MKLELLKKKIQSIEWSKKSSNEFFSFGARCIDEALPHKGLRAGCVHEWTGPFKGPLTGVCASIAGRISKYKGPVLWCSTKIDLFPQGLLNYGLPPEQVIFAKLNTQQELLWATEEGLSAGQLGCVIAETAQVPLSASRRLQLCAQKSGVPLFLLIDPKNAHSSAGTSVSRWFIEPMPSRAAPGLWQDNGLGAPRSSVTLLRYRGATVPRKWNLEWNAKTLSFDLLPTQQHIAYAS